MGAAYRAPRPEDDNSAEIRARLAEKLPEWEAFDIVPSEKIPGREQDYRANTVRHDTLARPVFAAATPLPRHRRRGVSRDAGNRPKGRKTHPRAEGGVWIPGAVAGQAAQLQLPHVSLDVRPDRSWFKHVRPSRLLHSSWSHAEMAPLIAGIGYDWAFEQTAKCIVELN